MKRCIKSLAFNGLILVFLLVSGPALGSGGYDKYNGYNQPENSQMAPRRPQSRRSQPRGLQTRQRRGRSQPRGLQTRQRRGRSQPRGLQTRQRRGRKERFENIGKQREEMAQKAQQDISAKYQQIIESLNIAAIPSEETVSDCRKTVLGDRRYLVLLDRGYRCDYFVLSAWTYHFLDKSKRALRQAMDSQIAEPLDRNALITRISLGILYQDYPQTVEALAAQQMRRVGLMNQRREQSRQKPLLKLDPNDIRIDLLGKTFAPGLKNIGPASKQTTVRNISCVLLFRLSNDQIAGYTPVDANGSNEPNKPVPSKSERPEPQTPEPRYPQIESRWGGMPMPPMQVSESQQPEMPGPEQFGTPYQQSKPVKEPANPREAFADLFSQAKAIPGLKFYAVNANSASNRKLVKNWLRANPQPWPVVVPNDVLLFEDGFTVKPGSPLFMVIDANSVVRYAGTASGFLPKMLIRKLLMSPVTFKKIKKLAVEPAPQSPWKRAAPSQSKGAGVKGAGPPPVAAAVSARQVKKFPKDYFNPHAEDLLQTAAGFFKIGNKTILYRSYKKPVDMCREVIRDYPGTKYEDRARTLLRRVPERYRSRYHITDEELGL